MLGDVHYSTAVNLGALVRLLATPSDGCGIRTGDLVRARHDRNRYQPCLSGILGDSSELRTMIPRTPLAGSAWLVPALAGFRTLWLARARHRRHAGVDGRRAATIKGRPPLKLAANWDLIPTTAVRMLIARGADRSRRRSRRRSHRRSRCLRRSVPRIAARALIRWLCCAPNR